MKQLKKLTRIQKIRLTAYFKQHRIRGDISDYAVAEENKEGFVVCLKTDTAKRYTVLY